MHHREQKKSMQQEYNMYIYQKKEGRKEKKKKNWKSDNKDLSQMHLKTEKAMQAGKKQGYPSYTYVCV